MNKGISILGHVNTTSQGGSQATDLRPPRMITPFVRGVTFFTLFHFFTQYFGMKNYIFAKHFTIAACQA